ncbi:MAG: hypothetical protein WAM96_00790 [Candidatus Acidiferrales bacterium]
MMRITVHEKPEATTMQLEGKVVGPWTREFDQTWRLVAGSLGSKRLCVDLREVLQMDADGRRVLAEIYKKTGADLLANTPMTKYFAEEARREDLKSTKEKK